MYLYIKNYHGLLTCMKQKINNHYIMNNIQAIIFNKKHFTPLSSNNWIKRHDFHPIKQMHETKHYYRYRIKEPKRGKIY